MTENINNNSVEEPVDISEDTEIKAEVKSEEGGDKDVKTLQDEISAQQAKYDELYDKYLRVSAEYENFRKRTAKEKGNIYFEAVIDVLNTLLPVMDNIESAVQFAETDNSDKVAEGLKMVHSQFLNSFEKLGIQEIQAQGEKFNPEIHNAVLHEHDESQPDNTIVDVLQKGYIKGEKVIRPAMVKVVN